MRPDQGTSGLGSIWSLRNRGPLPTSPDQIGPWMVAELQRIEESLRALVSLDVELRALRSLNAERAKLRSSFTATNLLPFILANEQPQVSTETYTTCFVAFAAASGAARYDYSGAAPTTGGAVGSGMPIPAGFSTLLVIGHENIRNLRIIAEGAGTPALVDYTLFQ